MFNSDEDFQLGSARDLFLSARKSKIGSKIGIFCRSDFFSFFHCIFRKIPVSDPENQSFLEEKLFATKKTEIRVNKVTILVKKKQEFFFLTQKKFYRQLGFSSKIEVPKLGSAWNPFGSARAGKFQLELITSIYKLEFCMLPLNHQKFAKLSRP